MDGKTESVEAPSAHVLNLYWTSTLFYNFHGAQTHFSLVSMSRCFEYTYAGITHLVTELPQLAMCALSSNKLTKKLCLTSGGKCNTTDTIYAAEYTEHNLIYIGHSSQKLSGRFNGHRSEFKVKPKACELSQHFHESKNCKIEKDVKVYILQDNATGTRKKREFMEDRWIISYHFIHLLFPLFYLYHMLNTTSFPFHFSFLFHPPLFTSDQS